MARIPAAVAETVETVEALVGVHASSASPIGFQLVVLNISALSQVSFFFASSDSNAPAKAQANISAT